MFLYDSGRLKLGVPLGGDDSHHGLSIVLKSTNALSTCQNKVFVTSEAFYNSDLIVFCYELARRILTSKAGGGGGGGGGGVTLNWG